MAPKDMKAALEASMRAEKDNVADRFAKAESYFAKKESSPPPSPSPSKKVVRDGFTMPTSDYELIAQIQARGMEVGVSVTKSEVLRAGLYALNNMSTSDLKQALTVLDKVKTGRPRAK